MQGIHYLYLPVARLENADLKVITLITNSFIASLPRTLSPKCGCQSLRAGRLLLASPTHTRRCSRKSSCTSHSCQLRAIESMSCAIHRGFDQCNHENHSMQFSSNSVKMALVTVKRTGGAKLCSFRQRSSGWPRSACGRCTVRWYADDSNTPISTCSQLYPNPHPH